MDFIDRLRELSARIPKLRETASMKTEEATKTALVMPFIIALGYDVHDPLEVTPELVADVGTKKGEKVDYAIIRDEKPIILFECKVFGTDLSKVHASQLYRYFSVTPCHFGVLTNGVEYRFYTDLDKTNVMDNEPFLIFNLAEIREPLVEELKRFTKATFDADQIMTVASQLKYKNVIKSYLSTLVNQPSEAFVRLALQESNAYRDRLVPRVIEQFTPIIRDALRMFISEQVENRLKIALASETASVDAIWGDNVSDEGLIETTEEELEAFMIVRAIVRPVIEASRVVMRDNQSYCAVNVDDNQRRPLCRLRLNSATHKYLGIFDEERNETKMPLASLDDIYNYADALKATAERYVNS